MSKKRKRAKKKSMQEQPQKQHSKSAKKRILTILSYTLGTIATVSAVLGLYFALYPFLVVSLSTPFDPSDPFSLHVEITNEGYILPIYDIQVVARIKELNATGYDGTHIEMENSTTTTPRNHFDKISARDKATTNFSSFGIKGPMMAINNADILIIIDFKPSFLFWHICTPFRFVAVRDSKNNIHWERQPVNTGYCLDPFMRKALEKARNLSKIQIQ